MGEREGGRNCSSNPLKERKKERACLPTFTSSSQEKGRERVGQRNKRGKERRQRKVLFLSRTGRGGKPFSAR